MGFRMGNVYAGPKPGRFGKGSRKEEVFMEDVYAGPEPEEDMEMDRDRKRNERMEAIVGGVYAGPRMSEDPELINRMMGPVYAGPQMDSDSGESREIMGFVYAGPQMNVGLQINTMRVNDGMQSSVMLNTGSGSADSIICGACGTVSPKGSKFCTGCGSLLVKASEENKRLPYPENRIRNI